MAILGMILFIENYRIITWVCQLLKKNTALTSRITFYSVDLKTSSQIALRVCSKEVREELDIYEFFPKKKKKKVVEL